jgi:hypothetical protein
MIGILILGLVLWLYGWHRALALLIACAATVVAVLLPMIVGALFSYLFWPELAKAWTLEAHFTDKLLGGEMKLWLLFFVPFTIFADLFRAFTLNVFQHFDIIIGAAYALMWFLLYRIWWGFTIFFIASGEAATPQWERELEETRKREEGEKTYSLTYRICAITGLMLALLGFAYVKEVYLKR